MSDEREAAAVSDATLGRIPVFSDLSTDECRRLIEISMVCQFEPDEFVIRQGETCQNLWIVMEGRCEVVRQVGPDDGDHRLTALDSLEPYQNFGEMSFFQAAPHSAHVRAKSPLELLRISRLGFNRLLVDNHPAAYKLAFNTLTTLADRLRRMDEWVVGLLEECREQRPREAEWSHFRDQLFSKWNL